MPIFDYRCHLPVSEIAENGNFDNLTQIWLRGDHYRWRATRANGIAERFVTGDGTDYEKFDTWATTVPKTLRNPLYNWTHLELKRYFGITGNLLNPMLILKWLERMQSFLIPWTGKTSCPSYLCPR